MLVTFVAILILSMHVSVTNISNLSLTHFVSKSVTNIVTEIDNRMAS